MNFRRLCNISKSGNAAIGLVMSAFVRVCLPVHMKKMKFLKILNWDVHQIYVQRSMSLVATLITNVTIVTFDINQ
jgi:hypothetical protein